MRDHFFFARGLVWVRSCFNLKNKFLYYKKILIGGHTKNQTQLKGFYIGFQHIWSLKLRIVAKNCILIGIWFWPKPWFCARLTMQLHGSWPKRWPLPHYLPVRYQTTLRPPKHHIYLYLTSLSFLFRCKVPNLNH